MLTVISQCRERASYPTFRFIAESGKLYLYTEDFAATEVHKLEISGVHELYNMRKCVNDAIDYLLEEGKKKINGRDTQP